MKWFFFGSNTQPASENSPDASSQESTASENARVEVQPPQTLSAEEEELLDDQRRKYEENLPYDPYQVSCLATEADYKNCYSVRHQFQERWRTGKFESCSALRDLLDVCKELQKSDFATRRKYFIKEQARLDEKRKNHVFDMKDSARRQVPVWTPGQT
eukprot:GILI01031311.1.p1 GENE.GILI01031311.1~~GILI01031311.1.p1  ORF type:complete len:167 (+),score=22.14 GILI01031311.1:30-503(+)